MIYDFQAELHGTGMSENHRTPQDTAGHTAGNRRTPQDTAGHHRTPQDTAGHTTGHRNEIKHYYKIKNRTSADKDIKISYE